MANNERIGLIEEVERNFEISGTVLAICKPRGFNSWCRLPYPKHPHGCPNFGVRGDCPPNVPYFLDVYQPEVKIAVLRFDFAEYLRWKRRIHPDWTERAIRNPRHFQGHLKAALVSNTESNLPDGYFPEFNAEAMGVNIHLTCKNAGINLEWPPVNVMHRIALLVRPIA